MNLENAAGFAGRVQGRLDRLNLDADGLALLIGLPAGVVQTMLDGDQPPPRGSRLIKMADALATSVSYLIGLDPDTPVPEEYLEEDQGDFGLLAGDEEALLRAYRRLDLSSKAALIQIVLKMAPEPDAFEKKPRHTNRHKD